MSEIFLQKYKELRLIGEPIFDGVVHYVCVEGAPKSKKQGAYLFDPARNFGYITNYKLGKHWTHPSNLSSETESAPEISLEKKKEIEAAQQKQNELNKRLSRSIQNYVSKLTPLKYHQYLKNKNIQKSFEELGLFLGEELPKSINDILQQNNRKGGNVRSKYAIIAPLRNLHNRELTSVQIIHANGFKSFLGSSQEGFIFFGADPKKARNIHIAEGLATILSIRDIAKSSDEHNCYIAVCSETRFDTCAKVLNALITEGQNVYVYPDGGERSKRNAIRAANTLYGLAVLPPFQDSSKDFNDYACEHGVSGLRTLVTDLIRSSEKKRCIVTR